MKIHCEKTFARPGRAFAKDQVVEVPDAEGQKYIGLGLAKEAPADAELTPLDKQPSGGETTRKRTRKADTAPAVTDSTEPKPE